MIVLASQSPRRSEILSNAGIAFTVRATGVPEQHVRGETPSEYVRRLSLAKAEAARRTPDEIVLGADTVVVVDKRILEKPAGRDDAERMLRDLSGREHTVITGIAISHSGRVIQDEASTTVRFVSMTAAEITEYVASDEPEDKAGAYAIQGLASKFIDRIDGDYFNVVGLPIALVYKHLKTIKVALHGSGTHPPA
jgi:septum formation protein